MINLRFLRIAESSAASDCEKSPREARPVISAISSSAVGGPTLLLSASFIMVAI